MRPPRPFFRLSLVAILAALPLAPATPRIAVAQGAQPAEVTDARQVDPPERVGRVASVNGGLSFRAGDSTDWTPAVPNYPVASGMAFATDPGSSAWLDLAAGRIALAGSSELRIGSLDEAGMRASLPTGEVYLVLTAPAEAWTLQTPRGQVAFSRDGRFAVAAGDPDTPTTVTVLEGSAEVATPARTLLVGSGQAAILTGTDTIEVRVGAAMPSAFVTVMRAADRPTNLAAVPPPAAVAQMPGGATLSEYGDWAVASDYGTVWYPRVEADWVPYRAGHWAWVAPWGWTWVDDAPWGFAPSHYGRWTEIDRRWAWIPYPAHTPYQSAYRPIYAPAVIGFLGVGAAFAIATRPVGWYPLGPRDAYRPWYHASPRYARAVNHPYLGPGPEVVRPYGGAAFQNRRGATMVPASAMVTSAPLRHLARPADASLLGPDRAFGGAAPVRPTAATAGITPQMARRMNLPPRSPEEPSYRGAPSNPSVWAPPVPRQTPATPGPRQGFSTPAPGPGGGTTMRSGPPSVQTPYRTDGGGSSARGAAPGPHAPAPMPRVTTRPDPVPSETTRPRTFAPPVVASPPPSRAVPSPAYRRPEYRAQEYRSPEQRPLEHRPSATYRAPPPVGRSPSPTISSPARPTFAPAPPPPRAAQPPPSPRPPPPEQRRPRGDR